jgi:hypothetical protein
MRKRLFATASVLGALLATAAPAQATHAERTKCTARNAHTILKTETGRIFSVPGGDFFAKIYGCLYSQNRRWFLGIDGDCDPGDAVDKFILIGRYVAFVETGCNIDSSQDYVNVRDLRTGRTKWRTVAATGTSDGEPSTEVKDLVMSRTGSVAWIGEWDANSGGISTPEPNDDRQVRKLEPGAPRGGTLLDRGFEIEDRSLGISARTSRGYSWIYWTKSDSPFAAKLN